MDTIDKISNVLHGVATLPIFKEIGGEKGIDGAAWASNLLHLSEHPDVKEIIVPINSPGGGVQDALTMFTAIHMSKKPVTTIAAGIVASSAGFIFMAGKVRKMNDIARLMIHGLTVRNEDGSEMLNISEEDKVAISNMRDIIAQIFENNSKMSFNDMVSLLSRTIWIKADQALNMGLIDEIITTKRPGIKFTENAIPAIYNQYKEVLNEDKIKIHKMKTVFNHLKLNDDAAETSVIDSIKAIENQVLTEKTEKETALNELEAAKKTVTELEGKVSSLEGEKKTAQDSEAVAFVANAIESGKYSADKKESLEKAAKADLVSFKNLTDAVTVNGPNLLNKIGNKGEVVNAIEGKTFRELEKKNPKALAELKENNLEAYKNLYKSQYGVEFTS